MKIMLFMIAMFCCKTDLGMQEIALQSEEIIDFHGKRAPGALYLYRVLVLSAALDKPL